jgi:hypothetical protein
VGGGFGESSSIRGKTPGNTIDTATAPSHNGGMRWKRVLTIGAVAVVAAGAVAAGSLLLTYHEATKIDRTNPEVVLIRYLDATFERKDPAMAGLYTCSNPKDLAPIDSLKVELERREKEFGVTVQVASSRMTTEQSAVTTDLTISGSRDGNITSRRVETWRFKMVDDGGWRVCGAERLAVPSASPSPVPSA